MIEDSVRVGLEELSSTCKEFDAEVDAFSRASGLFCAPACGICCEHTHTETTRVEALLIARFIRQEAPHVEKVIEAHIADTDREACLFFDPDRDYHCRIYPVRPLICRAFGFAVYSDRQNNRLFPLCPAMPLSHEKGGSIPIVSGPYPPVVERYSRRVDTIARKSSGNAIKTDTGESVLRELEITFPPDA